MSAFVGARKQVRFNTPTKSDPRLNMDCCDYPEPRPFSGYKSAPVAELPTINFDEVLKTPLLDNMDIADRPIYLPLFQKVIDNEHLSQDRTIAPTSGLDLSLFDDECNNSYYCDRSVKATATNNSQLPAKPLKSETDLSFFIKPGHKIDTMPYHKKIDFLKTTHMLPELVPNLKLISREDNSDPKNICCNSSKDERKTFLDDYCPSNCSKPVNKASCNCRVNVPIVRCCHQESVNMCNLPVKNVSCNNCRGLQNKNAETKTLAIDNYVRKNAESSNSSDDLSSSEKCLDSPKHKREPTVVDLLKIIKLQNEQLQLLNNKVDKLFIGNEKDKVTPPAIANVLDRNEVSVGCMTSFEMVRTSTYTTHEVKMKTQNVKIQCNKSEISIREIYGQGMATNEKFLEGIPKVNAEGDSNKIQSKTSSTESIDEKTVNELNLDNVIVDNAGSADISPQTSINIDIQDYSDSDNDELPNVGWTYYNKVMNRVDEMLHNNHHPSPVNAAKTKALPKSRLQIDRTDISVSTSKRVTFNEPLQVSPMIPVQHVYPAICATDLSMQMNRLALRYLGGQNQLQQYKGLQGVPALHTSAPVVTQIEHLNSPNAQPNLRSENYAIEKRDRVDNWVQNNGYIDNAGSRQHFHQQNQSPYSKAQNSSPYFNPNTHNQSPRTNPSPHPPSENQSPYLNHNVQNYSPYSNQTPYLSPKAQNQLPYSSPNAQNQLPYSSPNAQNQLPYSSPNAQNQLPYSSPNAENQLPNTQQNGCLDYGEHIKADLRLNGRNMLIQANNRFQYSNGNQLLEISAGTRNYMEQHKLIQGGAADHMNAPSRFLDITALKQQPKLL